MQREIIRTSKFKKDYKRVLAQGKDKEKLAKLLELLVTDSPLPEKHKDHSLKGNWTGNRECHIEPDWLLTYQKTEDNRSLILLLTGTGSHAELFD